MSETELSEKTALALIQAIKSGTSPTFLSTLPAPPSTRARAAVKRCRAAWQRAFDAYMIKNKRETCANFSAAEKAREAYRNAMPLLVDYEGIRAFLACLSHGILIEAIPIEMSGQLAYAAQVALGTLRSASRSSASKPTKPLAKTTE